MAKQIKKPLKIILYYLPLGSQYGRKTKGKDGYLALTINNSKATRFSREIEDKDMSVTQLLDYLKTCVDALDEGGSK